MELLKNFYSGRTDGDQLYKIKGQRHHVYFTIGLHLHDFIQKTVYGSQQCIVIKIK